MEIKDVIKLVQDAINNSGYDIIATPVMYGSMNTIPTVGIIENQDKGSCLKFTIDIKEIQ
jgi:hypothetical protein